MTDDELVAAFTTYQEGKRFSPRTLRRREGSLLALRRFVAPATLADVTPGHVDEWLARMASPRTAHAYQSDAAVFFRWAVRRGLLEVNPLDGEGSVRVPKGLPRPVPTDVLEEALRIADDRYRVALMLGAFAGLRVSEIRALRMDDVYLDASPPILVVREGKGGKDRIVPLHPQLAAELKGRKGLLFESPSLPGRPIAVNGLGSRIANLLQRAAGDGRRWTCHNLRHWFGTHTAESSGGNVVLGGKLMGHATTDTTLNYMGWSGGDGADVVAGIWHRPVDELTARRRQRAS